MNNFLIVTILSLLIMITGCFETNLHEKLKNTETSKLIKFENIKNSIVEEINCERYAEHSENFVTLMINNLGLEAVRQVAKSEMAINSINKFLIQDYQSKLQVNLEKTELLQIRNKNVKIENVKPVRMVSGYLTAVRESSSEEVKGYFFRLMSNSEHLNYLNYQKSVYRELEMACRADQLSSECLSDEEVTSMIKEKINSLGEEIFIKDFSYESDIHFSVRTPRAVTLINDPYDYNRVASYKLPTFRHEFINEEDERSKEIDIQKIKYSSTKKNNLIEIAELKKAKKNFLFKIAELNKSLRVPR